MITALLLGTMHAFEVDHVLAMSSIVTKKSKWTHAVKEGAFWGMGHTSTILIIGILMILLRIAIPDNTFHYFEALVGVMLIGLGIYRIVRFFKKNKVVLHSHPHHHDIELKNHGHEHRHLHLHVNTVQSHQHNHISYGIGLMHGLAGSGELVVATAALYTNPWLGVFYLALFGMGTIFGMMIATGLLHIPFTQKALLSNRLSVALAWLSAILCIVYGSRVVTHNLHLVSLV